MAMTRLAPDIVALDATNVRDIAPEVLDADGRLKVMPASFWAATTVEERAVFGGCHGFYGFPTLELVARLKEIIGDRSAIEIGSGNGVLAEALGIPATDSFLQRRPEIRQLYEINGWARVPYGKNVIEMHASRAVREFKPEVVVACWVTHKRTGMRPELGGNPFGVDEPDILRHCAQYVLIGNEGTHAKKPIWDRKYAIEYPDYVFSRATNGSRDFIATFEGLKWKG